MNKTKKLHFIGLILNLAIIAIAITGIAMLRVTIPELAGGKIFLRYDVIAGCITLLASILMIFANIVSIKREQESTPRFFFNLRFVSTVMCGITLGLAIYSICSSGKPIDLNNQGAVATLLLYFIVPSISVLEFIGTQLEPECRFRKTFVPFLFTILYSAAVIIVITVVAMGLKAKGVVGQDFINYINPFIPYDLFRLSPDIIFVEEAAKMDALKQNAVSLILFILISYVISFIIWSLNRIASSIIVGVTYDKKEKTVIVKENVATRIKKSFSMNTHENNEGKIYHISYANRKEKTWKVKGELAGRANKIFSTQKEAIEFANELVKKNGGSIRIHSMVGRIRKDW